MPPEFLVPQEDPVLHTAAQDVPKEMFRTKKLAAFVEKMRAGLRSYDAEGYVGVAIAAPQVGIPYRLFLVEDMNPSRREEEALPTLVAVNPRITKRSRKKVLLGEGCLSVPNHYGSVARSENVTLEAYDEEGKKFVRGAGGLLAQIFQHECDHLRGVLFVDVAEKVYEKTSTKQGIRDFEQPL